MSSFFRGLNIPNFYALVVAMSILANDPFLGVAARQESTPVLVGMCVSPLFGPLGSGKLQLPGNAA